MVSRCSRVWMTFWVPCCGCVYSIYTESSWDFVVAHIHSYPSASQNIFIHSFTRYALSPMSLSIYSCMFHFQHMVIRVIYMHLFVWAAYISFAWYAYICWYDWIHLVMWSSYIHLCELAFLCVNTIHSFMWTAYIRLYDLHTFVHVSVDLFVWSVYMHLVIFMHVWFACLVCILVSVWSAYIHSCDGMHLLIWSVYIRSCDLHTFMSCLNMLFVW